MAITYDDLKICAELINEVRDSQERGDWLRAQLERCTPRMSATGDRHTNTFTDKYADILQKIMDLEASDLNKIEAYMEHVQIVKETIDQCVTDSTQRRIILFRFINGLSWGDIAARMFMSDKWCMELCDRGLSSMGIERPRKRRNRNKKRVP